MYYLCSVIKKTNKNIRIMERIKTMLDCIERMQSTTRTMAINLFNECAFQFINMYADNIIYFEDGISIDYYSPNGGDSVDGIIKKIILNSDGTISTIHLYLYYEGENVIANINEIDLMTSDYVCLAENIIEQIENERYVEDND